MWDGRESAIVRKLLQHPRDLLKVPPPGSCVRVFLSKNVPLQCPTARGSATTTAPGQPPIDWEDFEIARFGAPKGRYFEIKGLLGIL